MRARILSTLPAATLSALTINWRSTRSGVRAPVNLGSGHAPGGLVQAIFEAALPIESAVNSMQSYTNSVWTEHDRIFHQGLRLSPVQAPY